MSRTVRARSRGTATSSGLEQFNEPTEDDEPVFMGEFGRCVGLFQAQAEAPERPFESAGLRHVAFTVDSLERAQERLGAHGVIRDLTRLTSAITSDCPDRRAVLIGSHIVGIALARYVVLVEPLASLPSADVVELLAPTFQRFLVEPLTEPERRAPKAMPERRQDA